MFDYKFQSMDIHALEANEPAKAQHRRDVDTLFGGIVDNSHSAK